MQGAPLEARKELAQRLESDRILAAFQRLWELKTRVRVSDDARGNLELALMLISDVFSRGKTSVSTLTAPKVEQVPVTARKLTLSEIQQRK